MNRKMKLGGLVVLALVPLLIAASGGFPSRPRFQSLTVVGDANLNTIDGIAITDFARVSQAASFPSLTLSGDLSVGGLIRSPVSTNGSALTIAGGDCNGAGNTCNDAVFRAGEQTASDGNGGAATFRAGHGLGTNRSGGNLFVHAGNGTGAAIGGNLEIQAGNSPSGTAGTITFRTSNTTRATWSGAGVLDFVIAPTVNGISITPAEGSAATCNGFSSVPTCQVRWAQMGRLACIGISVSGTSNATTFTVSGVTAPSVNAGLSIRSQLVRLLDSGTGTLGTVDYSGGTGTLTFGVGAGGSGGGFTASGTKAASGAYCYPVN